MTTPIHQRGRYPRRALSSGDVGAVDPRIRLGGNLSLEFCRSLVAENNSELMAELASRVRNMLDEMQQNPHAHCNSAFLSVAGGITQFLEEMLLKIRRGAF